MKKIKNTSRYKFLALCFVFVLSIASFALLPSLTPRASAAQITGRKLTLGSGLPSASTTYVFDFTVPTTGTAIKSFSADACTTAVGTCTIPTGFSVSVPGATLTAQPTGFGAATGWTVNTATAGKLRILNASNATNPSGAQHVSFSTVTSPSTTNTAFFLRMTTYSDSAWTTALDTGTTASAVTQATALTVNAAVAEVLNFCVGATAVDNATVSVGADCTAVSGTSVNIGTLDTAAPNISPVSTNGGDSNNGVAMIRTNAASGATVSYVAVQQTGTNHKGALRISGATCSAIDGTPGTDTTDQCINSAGTTQAAFTSPTEKFGMTIAGVNCGSTTSYTCVYGSGSNNLQQQTNYIGGANATTYGASAAKGFAWDETGASAVTIASSASSTTKVIDDEALILKFAAIAAITTPFGLYSAQADFIAVPTY